MKEKSPIIFNNYMKEKKPHYLFFCNCCFTEKNPLSFKSILGLFLILSFTFRVRTPINFEDQFTNLVYARNRKWMMVYIPTVKVL